MSKISDSGIAEQQKDWGTREVTITIRLPHDIADQVEAIEAAEPEFLSRIVQYGITRRAIYEGIRDRTNAHAREHGLRVDGFDRVIPIEESEGRRILAENRHHDGGAWADKELPSQDEIDEADYNNSLNDLELKRR